MRPLLLLLFCLIIGEARAQTDASGYTVLAEGTIAPDIKGIDQEGKPVCLSKVKATYVAVFFYEAGCHFCEYILPDLQRFYQREHGANLEIVAVALTTDAAAWKEQLAAHTAGWTELLPADVNKVRQDYRIEVAPTIYLIDRKHRVRSTRLVRSDDLELRWFELFNEL